MIKLTSKKNHQPVFDLSTYMEVDRLTDPGFTASQFFVPAPVLKTATSKHGRFYIPVVEAFYQEYKDSGKYAVEDLIILTHKLHIPMILGDLEQPRSEHRDYIAMMWDTIHNWSEESQEPDHIFRQESIATTAIINHFVNMETVSEKPTAVNYGSISKTAEFYTTISRLQGQCALIEIIYTIYGKH